MGSVAKHNLYAHASLHNGLNILVVENISEPLLHARITPDRNWAANMSFSKDAYRQYAHI